MTISEYEEPFRSRRHHCVSLRRCLGTEPRTTAQSMAAALVGVMMMTCKVASPDRVRSAIPTDHAG